MEKSYKFIGVFSLVLSIIGMVCGLYTFYGVWIETSDFNFFTGSKIFHLLFAFSTLNLDFSNKFDHLETWSFIFYTLLFVGSLQFLKTKGRETRLLGFVFSVIFLNAIIIFLQSTIFKLFFVKWGNYTAFQIFNSIYSSIILVGMVIVSFRISKIIKSKKEIDIIETQYRKSITDTSRWQRFFHWIIDSTIMALIFIPIIIFLSHGFIDSDMYRESESLQMFFRGKAALYVITFVVLFIYYPISEILFGASPAKFLTESRVVNSKAESPNFSSIFLRTLCRNIPFDALSFFSQRGWHDSLSETYVVKEKTTGFKTNKLLWILPFLIIYLLIMYFGKEYFTR